jgi:hypothetical protein
MSLLVPAVYVVTTADVLAHIGLVNRISVFFWRNHYSEILQQVNVMVSYDPLAHHLHQRARRNL